MRFFRHLGLLLGLTGVCILFMPFFVGRINAASSSAPSSDSAYYPIYSNVSTRYDNNEIIGYDMGNLNHGGKQGPFFYFISKDKKATSGIRYTTVSTEFSKLRAPSSSVKNSEKTYTVLPSRFTSYNSLIDDSPSGVSDPHYILSDGKSRVKFNLTKRYQKNNSYKTYWKTIDGYIYTIRILRKSIVFGIPGATKDEYKGLLNKAKLANRLAWRDEIDAFFKSEGNEKFSTYREYWIGVDSIIQCYNYRQLDTPADDDYHSGKEFGHFKNNKYAYYTNGTKIGETYDITGKKVYNYRNWYPAFVKEHPWAAGESGMTASIKKRYKQYVKLYTCDDIPDEGTEDNYTLIKNPSELSNLGDIEEGEAVPTINTGNSSDTYDLGTGIPTTEAVDNETFASRWFGTMRFQKIEVTHNLSVKYTGSGTYTAYGTTSSGHTYSYTATQSASGTHKKTVKATYWVLTYVEVYQMSELFTLSDCFEFDVSMQQNGIDYTNQLFKG